MNIAALPGLISSWLKGQGTEQLQAGKDLAPSPFKVGAQYEGKVLESLPNGRNIVQVGNQAMDMTLPQQAKTGDVIRLTFLSATPRPTFVLNAPPVAGAVAQAVTVSSAAQQVNALVRYMPVSASTPMPAAAIAKATTASMVPTTVSTTVSTATPTVSIATTTPATVNLAGSRPPNALSMMMTSTPPSAATVARPIVANPAVLLAPAPTAVTLTGLVVAGPVIPAMSMADEAVEGARAALGAHSSLVKTEGAVADLPTTSHVLPMRLQQTVKESGLFYESHLGKWVRGEVSLESIQREPQAGLLQSPGPLLNLPDLEGMPEQAARLASRQLNMLEGGPFVWQGEAWPGQMAEWQVEDRKGSAAEVGADGQKWHSRLRLSLPRLGDVAADLDIGAQGLRIRLQSGSPITLAEINAAMPELVQRMKIADLNLSSLNAELADAG